MGKGRRIRVPVAPVIPQVGVPEKPLGGTRDKKAKKTPHSWVGKEVEVGLAVPAGHLDRDPYTLHPVGGVYKLGILEEVNEHGIVGAFSGIHDVLTERPAPRSRFYPWSAVLSIGSPEDPDVAEVRPIR